MTIGDWSMLVTALVGAGAVVSAIVITALRLQWFITKQFEAHRKLMYRQFSQRDKAIKRIEYFLVKDSLGEFQPGINPIEFGPQENGSGEEEH